MITATEMIPMTLSDLAELLMDCEYPDEQVELVDLISLLELEEEYDPEG